MVAEAVVEVFAEAVAETMADVVGEVLAGWLDIMACMAWLAWHTYRSLQLKHHGPIFSFSTYLATNDKVNCMGNTFGKEIQRLKTK